MFSTYSARLLITSTAAIRPRHEILQYLVSFLTAAAIVCSAFVSSAEACSAVSGQTGVASYYGPGLHGRRTANGERFDMWAMTAAHACLPMGTKIRVTVLETGRTLIVTVNDRLPSRRRVLDLSMGAAQLLGITAAGLATVQLSPA